MTNKVRESGEAVFPCNDRVRRSVWLGNALHSTGSELHAHSIWHLDKPRTGSIAPASSAFISSYPASKNPPCEQIAPRRVKPSVSLADTRTALHRRGGRCSSRISAKRAGVCYTSRFWFRVLGCAWTLHMSRIYVLCVDQLRGRKNATDASSLLHRNRLFWRRRTPSNVSTTHPPQSSTRNPQCLTLMHRHPGRRP